MMERKFVCSDYNGMEVIWAKALVFAADAGSYAFWLGVSMFVRGLCVRRAAVRELVWEISSEGEAVR